MKSLYCVAVAAMIGAIACAAPGIAADDASAGRIFTVSDMTAEPAAQPCVACEGACDDCGRSGACWVLTIDGVAMKRSSAGPTPIVNNSPNEPTMNAKDQLFKYAPGVQMSLIRQTECNAIEFRYLGTSSWVARQDATYTVASTSPGGTALNGPAWARDYTRLDSLEMNLIRENCRWFKPILGFRWIQFQDELIVGQTLQVVTTPTPTTARVLASNELFGVQVGGTGRIWDRCGPLTVDAFVKAGFYDNMALRQSDESTGASSGFNLHRGAFVGEVGVVATYELTCRLSARGGYQVMWADGLALAPDQIGNIVGARDAMTWNSVLMDGIFGGVEYRF